MKILTSEQMKNIDRRTTEQFGIPSILLMENAAIAVVDAIAAQYEGIDNVAIFCGTGQNGGDGLAVGRLLANRGVVVHLFVLGGRNKIAGDAATNLRICELLELPLSDVDTTDDLDRALVKARECDLVIDAIFGTGLTRTPEGLHADAIRAMSSLRIPVVAIDLPSGLNASSREAGDLVVPAQLTVTFAQPKICHIFEPAALYCGEVVVADISIPDAAIDAENVALSLTTPEDLAPMFPLRVSETHKGTYGHVAMLSGSAGKSGAAILAARGALRSGAGLVTVITDRATAAIVDSASVESMTLPLDELNSSGAAVIAFLEKMSAALVGPGLPDDEESYTFIRDVVGAVEIPLVLDATAVNAFRGDAAAINPNGLPRIITPHPGELARLLGTTTADVNRDRIAIAAQTAKLTKCAVILKGYQSVIADPDGQIAVNPTGNPGMATGGMGDVLGGLAVSLLGQDFAPFDAARAAAYLHGLAGDLVKDERSDTGLTAMEVADGIPYAIEQLRTHR